MVVEIGIQNLEKEFIKEAAKYKKVIIYGAGLVANILAERLLILYLDLEIEHFLVTKQTTNQFYLLGRPVYELKQPYVYQIEDTLYVIATKENLHDQIKKNLKSYGINNIFCISNKLSEFWQDDRKNLLSMSSEKYNYVVRYMDTYLKTMVEGLVDEDSSIDEIEYQVGETISHLFEDTLYVPRLVVVLGTKCSLRCKECNNLMPHFKPQMDLDADRIIDSLKILTDRVDNIYKCELIGGEPFLSKNLERVLEYTLNNSKIKKIEITTNGTLIPNSTLVHMLKNPKITIRISNYGDLVDKSKLIYFLKENMIQYVVLELGEWVSPGGVFKRDKDFETIKKNYQACSSGYYCKTLYEDKIFSCARAASLYALGYMQEPEYIQVEENFKSDDLKKFLVRSFSIACNYCDIANDEKIYVEPAEQL